VSLPQCDTYTLHRHGSLPVRGWLYTPAPRASPINVIVLFHPTISQSGTTPLDSARRFLEVVVDASKLNLGSNIVFACAFDGRAAVVVARAMQYFYEM
jgi:hypothetical protein